MRYLNRICFSFLFVYFFSFPVFSSKSKVSEKAKGIWYQSNETEPQSFEWKAAWIWADEKIETDAIFARRLIQLEELPQKTVLRITASSQYQLYINGEYICRGPARSAPHHQSYDILEISELLKVGENLIAVQVHHQDGKKSYQYDGRAGLLAQLNIENGETIYKSNSNWKILPDPSWDNNAPKISRFQQVVNDRVNFSLYPKGWKTLNFDDNEWMNATELMRKNGWPAPQKNANAQPLTPPWTSLVARDIPYLIEKDINAKKLIEAVQISTPVTEKAHALTGDMEVVQDNNGRIELPVSRDSKSWLLVYDFGEVINGMPKLDIRGAAGTEVEIVTAPFIVDNQFTHITVDSEFRDKIILSGERDKWEATYFKPTRYLGVIVKNNEVLQINSVGIHQISYPFELKGEMSSTDASWVKEYFDASAKTINVCTTDAITDNYRERRQYAQTAYYGILGNYFSFGDLALQRRYLVQVAQEQTANGIMPAYAPAASDDYMIIIGSNCLWIRGLKNYLLYSGDERTVRELIPAAQKMMELLHRFTNTNGLMDNPPYAYWLDHSINDRRGANLTMNGHYWGALTDFAELLLWLNVDGSEVFEKRAESLKSSIQLFWDNKKQLFADALIDGKHSTLFSEHGNAMALATGSATPEQAKLVAEQILADDKHDYMKRESGITMVTPAMSYFLHKGLCNYGFINESFELFRRRFDMMLGKNTNRTLWEEWWLDGTGRTGKLQKGRTRSDAQTESAFPPALFAEYLLGIEITKPGMKEVLIKKTVSSLKNIESSIPTPQGNLKLKWTSTKNSRKLELEVPDGVVVRIDLKSLKITMENQIKLNDKTLDSKLLMENELELSKGIYAVEF